MCGQFQFSQKLDCPAMRRLSVLAGQARAQLPDGDIAPGCLAPVLVAGPGTEQIANAFLDYVMSAEGQAVIAENKYIPVK